MPKMVRGLDALLNLELWHYPDASTGRDHLSRMLRHACGVKGSRPGSNRVIEDARASKFERILAWKTGQIWKIPSALPKIIRTLDDHGIRLSSSAGVDEVDIGTVREVAVTS